MPLSSAAPWDLLRKSVLQEIGGWDQWCITEDAEASLRILNRGYQSLFIQETFGRGLMPLDFEGLKKQRFRWAFGGVQIIKKHWGKLMPWAHWIDPANRLTAKQRYIYLAAGLQWFNELLTFAFTAMVLVSATLAITGHSAYLRPTTDAFIILPIVLIGTNLLRALWGLRQALHLSWTRAVAALTLWFGLTWVVTLACIQAIVQRGGVFLRTPKSRTHAAWQRALQVTSLETTLGSICALAGVATFIHYPSVLTVGLMLICFSQAMIYLSAPSHSLASFRGSAAQRRMAAPQPREIQGTYTSESRLGLQLGAVVVGLLLFALVASLWPTPGKLPWWYSLLPQPPPPAAPVSIPTLAAPLPTVEVPTLPIPTLIPTLPPTLTLVPTLIPRFRRPALRRLLRCCLQKRPRLRRPLCRLRPTPSPPPRCLCRLQPYLHPAPRRRFATRTSFAWQARDGAAAGRQRLGRTSCARPDARF